MYTIKNSVNKMSDEINLIMAEGPFDLIGVYNKYYSVSENSNNIFTAPCGKNYLSIINKFLRLGFANINIKIFSDSEIGINFYKYALKNIPSLLNVEIIYNTLYEDFGCSPEKIRKQNRRI